MKADYNKLDKNKRYFVTGAAGFIGFHLSKRLLKEDCQVIGLDNLNDYYDVNLKRARLDILKQDGNFQFIYANLEDKDAIDKVFKEYKINIVVNLAAQAGVRYSLKNPYAYIQSNIVGFMNILEACRYNKVEHLVYASSSSVYGSNEKMPFSTSDNVDHPISLYAATKKSNELMAHTYSHLYGIPTTGLRFFTVYGPWGRPDMALFLFTKAILNDEPIKVFNYGKMERDFTYVDDIIEGVIRVISNPPKLNENFNRLNPNPSTSFAPYKIYNIGNNHPVKLIEFIEILERHLGKKAKKEYLPLQAGDVPKTYADVDDLVRDVGFKPNTSVDEGIRKFVEWYREYYGGRNDQCNI
ncbi:Protein CapI [Tepidanaerobacter acetatoxydans Re1]|uniref:Protein CapI n=1 Tax=Tepidanaerobacter acetatoxydans (strain DSM 21804 / JCM 16047 / Re1) TaxID=1209989 RepID=F4LX99_TEPAE|nr:NAD-dependent epimerase [Tepidanaerobacter acetatoxydans]AEE91898.1 UDP-glucuronate 5'-epimerase [Tepidanaerobacter acetatoxydans Re1]CCP26719.1 Protein CapI [Tepidanaerobacter acetatoxydans Re1]